MADKNTDNDQIKTWSEERMVAVAAMREIAQRPERRAEDEAAYTKANDDIDRLQKLIEGEVRCQAAEREHIALEIEHRQSMKDAVNGSGAKLGNGQGDGKRAETYLDQIRKALKEERQTVGGTNELLPDPSTLFVPMDRHTRGFSVATMRKLERRTTLAVGTSGSGPEVVPETLVAQVFQKLFDDTGFFRAGPTILNTSDGQELKFPRLTSTGAIAQTSARRAESQAVVFGEPTFDQVILNAYKYMHGAKMTREIMQDAIIDVQSIVAAQVARNLRNYFGYDLINGTGTGMPRGLLTVIGTNVVTGATGQTGGLGGTVGGSTDEFSKLIDVTSKLKPGYRDGAKWLISDGTQQSLRKVKYSSSDGTNSFAWQPGLGSAPDQLLEYPVAVDPYMPAVALGAVSLAFGNFEYYWVRNVANTRVEWSTEFAWDTDEVAVKMVVRADGDAIDDAAFTGFKGAAS